MSEPSPGPYIKKQSPPQPRMIGAMNWVGLYTLIHREVMRFLVVILQTIVAPMITTLLFYAVFALALGGQKRMVGDVPFLDFLAPGLIMMTMVQNAFANTSSSIMISKFQGNIVDILMPPLSSLELYIGYITGGIVRGLAVGLTTGLMVSLFISIDIYSYGFVLAFGLLGSMMLGSLGIAAGIWAEKFDHIAGVTNFIVTPLTFLSGTFYSIQSLPESWHAIALYNPFFYMIDGFRYGFTGHADGSVMTGIAALAGINVVLALLILWMFKSGYRLKS